MALSRKDVERIADEQGLTGDARAEFMRTWKDGHRSVVEREEAEKRRDAIIDLMDLDDDAKELMKQATAPTYFDGHPDHGGDWLAYYENALEQYRLHARWEQEWEEPLDRQYGSEYWKGQAVRRARTLNRILHEWVAAGKVGAAKLAEEFLKQQDRLRMEADVIGCRDCFSANVCAQIERLMGRGSRGKAKTVSVRGWEDVKELLAISADRVRYVLRNGDTDFLTPSTLPHCATKSGEPGQRWIQFMRLAFYPEQGVSRSARQRVNKSMQEFFGAEIGSGPFFAGRKPCFGARWDKGRGKGRAEDMYDGYDPDENESPIFREMTADSDLARKRHGKVPRRRT